MLNKVKTILKILLTSLLIINLLKTCAHAETLTKLENDYTNEQVMEYLLENITIYTNKSIYGTTWATCKSNWENEPNNVVFYYYYNNNASTSYARTASFMDGTITWNKTNSTNPNTNNLNMSTGYELFNMGNNQGQAHYNRSNNYSCAWGNNINNNYLKYYIYKDDNGDWWQYTNDPNISLENIQSGLDFELASTKSITNYQDDGLYWYFQYMYSNYYWLLGTFTNANEFDEVEFKLKDSDSDITIATAYATQNYTHDGMSINNGQLLIDNYKIYLNQRYYLEYTCYKDGEIVDYFAYQIVFMNRNAVITNGEITSVGSGDSYTNQDQTNTELNFWQETYQKMFTTSGDYIQSKFDEVKNDLHISGDSELEKSFIDLITQNHEDFVISWNTIDTPYLKLSGDSINFSKLERENESLHEAMEWERAIVGFALGSLLIRNYWTTFLMALGIGTQVYDKEDQEKTIVSYNEQGDRSITRTKKVGNLTIRRKSK